MKKLNVTISPEILLNCLLGVISVAALTAVMWLIGRPTLGEAVIALLYLVPIAYSTTRWGQASGICAAVGAALAFDFFFIPPFYTFNIGSLEGWLVLVIFLAVAILIVGRIQFGLAQARQREREAIFMYELSSALAGLRSQEAIARTLANHMQQLYQAALVKVVILLDGSSQTTFAPPDGEMKNEPDLSIPIMAGQGMAGEISIWRGKIPIPSEENRLLQSFAMQGALALERAWLDENRTKT
jgi:two-component system, OmpR family, sensor histidine kinase KdpD